MGNEPRVAIELGLHIGMLVGAVVVHYQMQRHVAGEFRIQTPQESQELLVAVPDMTLTDDFPLQRLQSCE